MLRFSLYLTLLDEPSGPLMKQMSKGSAQLRVPGSIAAGVPADLMRNRPDVRYYEALLHAATAEIGVATADMLPSVSLSGTVRCKRWGKWLVLWAFVKPTCFQPRCA